MTAFISIYILLGAVCVCLLSAETNFIVNRPVGSTAVLPCYLPSVESDTSYIKWQIKSQTQFRTVFERLNGEDFEGEGYETRVDVPVEDLHKMTCSLVVRKLIPTDAGVYTSYQRLRHNMTDVSVTNTPISRVFLSVSDQTEERKPSDKTEETSNDKSDSPGNGGRNLQYLWLLVLPGLVLAGLVV